LRGGWRCVQLHLFLNLISAVSEIKLDLCEAHNIKGYPTLSLYRDNDFVETFRKNRDLGLLLEYVSLNAEKTKSAKDSATSSSASSTSAPPPEYNTEGTVLALDPSTFGPTIKKGPAFIKFFAPWCGHCKKLAPHWKDLAKHMQYKMTIAEVNCEDHGSLCKKEGIEGYPALFFYPGSGAEKSEYLGGRKLEQLSAFADKANEP
jgi:thioredoxin domain-containing protein 5